MEESLNVGGVGLTPGLTKGALPFLGGVRFRPLYFFAPANITVRQACTIVGEYLKEHPERWNEPAHFLVLEALIQAFPRKH